MEQHTKLNATTASALSLSAFASFIGMCCIGPWAVTLFGVSGAVTLARLDVLRPYILGVTIPFLAWSFWRVYRPVDRDGVPYRGHSSLWLKVALWVAALLLVIAIFAEPIQWLFINSTPGGSK